MKAAIVLAAAGLVAAQLPDISNVPQCAITCLLPALTSTGCSLTDLSCACKSENQDKIRSQATPCLEKGCSKDDLQKALDAANSLCGGGVSGIPSGSGSATSSGAASTGSSSGAASSPATTGSASSTGGVVPPVTSSTASSGHSTALPGNGTSTTHTTHTSSSKSGSATSSGSSPTSSSPGTNDAAGPVAGVVAAIAAAVFAL
ncbi:hypothetical protein V2A60_010162 [Cordyceps javanica]|uniref:Mediator of RNA polymerase II transcription subunit 31 n=1 Tax=Cordyceps javanica TaxID=43265 RepID=A0A545UVE5_9HYPO|nr:mediator of RNA polymerase II transcription subunit 31 [Cordyceps javanica]TQW05222.1 mediator of RNA polymerase II transcription subunit 31 [Cordyceps javanica]